MPVDLTAEPMPKCVCPVRTADKNNGKARFVHNSRKVNACVPPERVSCKLETLLKTRNMYMQGGYIIGFDLTSGYHCLYLLEDHQTYLAFALHVPELTDDAIQWLHDNHPGAYVKHKQVFVFKYQALPFGLSSSCKAFNDLITCLVASWRRYPSGG